MLIIGNFFLFNSQYFNYNLKKKIIIKKEKLSVIIISAEND